jgi:ribosomal-protein-alanine N-acetyltransferase
MHSPSSQERRREPLRRRDRHNRQPRIQASRDSENCMNLPQELLTERLRMRPPKESDAERLFARYAHDAEVCRYMSWRPHRTVDDTYAWLKRIEDEGRTVRLIFLRSSDELLGAVGGLPQGHRVEFGYSLARDAWGQGFATEAARAFVSAVMEDSSVWRVQACCDVENRASARVLEKVGLTREGLLRRYMVMPNISDDPRDMWLFAKVRETAL